MQPQNLAEWRNKAEKVTETIIFACRWLLAPFYLGLALSLIVLLIKFTEELFHLTIHAFSLSEPDVVLGVLSLVDMALTGSLLIIVIFSGYENFVSRFDHSDHKDWPAWMGTIDFSALKLKLLSSIVAISAIQLLKQFMSLQKATDRDLFWLVVIHVVFVVSSVLLAVSDRISGHDSPSHGNGGDGKGDEPAHGPAPDTKAAPEPSHAPKGEILMASATPVTPSTSARDPKKGHK